MDAPRALALACLLAVASAPGCGGGSPGSSDVPVDVERIALDPLSNTPVVVLEEHAGSRRLPIWIGIAEARSIAQRLEDVEAPRPNTHDLAKRLVEGLDAAVERVTVTDLQEGIYYAVIEVRTGGKIVEIDSRPSDAIALALRTAAPVFVREFLFEDAGGERFAPDAPQEPFRESPPERRT